MEDKESNYFINVQGWMVKKLHLSGNDLLVMGLIYGFSQDGKTEYKGSLSWIASGIGASKSTALRSIKNLISKNLIFKRHVYGVMYEDSLYRANLEYINQILVGGIKMTQGYSQNDTTPLYQNDTTGGINLTPNISIDNNINNNISFSKKKYSKEESFNTLKEKAPQDTNLTSAKSYNKESDCRYLLFSKTYKFNESNLIMQRLWSKLTEEEKDRIYVHVVKYFDYQPDKSYIVDAKKYLIEKRFDFDVIDRRPKEPKKELIKV